MSTVTDIRTQRLGDRQRLVGSRAQWIPRGELGGWFLVARRRVIGDRLWGWDKRIPDEWLHLVPEDERVFITLEDLVRELEEIRDEIEALHEEAAEVDEMFREQLDDASRFAGRHVAAAVSPLNAAAGVLIAAPLATTSRTRSTRRRRTRRLSRGSPRSDPDEPEPPLGRAA